MNRLLLWLTTACLLVTGSAPARAATAYGVPALSREDFNRLAAAAGVPLYWKPDSAPTAGALPAPQSLLPVGVADISA